jgi:hypothetical protein
VANGQQQMVNGRRGIVVLTSREALAGLDLCVQRVGDEADNIEVGDAFGRTIEASGARRESAPGGPVWRKFRTTCSRSGCCTVGRGDERSKKRKHPMGFFVLVVAYRLSASTHLSTYSE